MIPLTALLHELYACFYAIFVVEAPKRRVAALQKRLRALVDQIDQGTRKLKLDIVKSTIGTFQHAKPVSPCNGRVYPKTIVQNALSQIEARMAAYNSVSGVHPPMSKTMHRAVKSRPVTKAMTFGAMYGVKPQMIRKTLTVDDSDDDVLRRARYELYYVEGDEERLLNMIELVKQRFPLEAMALDLA